MQPHYGILLYIPHGEICYMTIYNYYGEFGNSAVGEAHYVIA